MFAGMRRVIAVLGTAYRSLNIRPRMRSIGNNDKLHEHGRSAGRSVEADRTYAVRCVNGTGVGGIGRLRAAKLADAIEQAEHWARGHALKSPRTDWTQWKIELTDEDGTTHTISFPLVAKDAS